LEPDIDHCNYLILDGTQSGFVANHLPMDLAGGAEGVERGMLVVIDPIETAGIRGRVDSDRSGHGRAVGAGDGERAGWDLRHGVSEAAQWRT
jgi:hypothetical protein